MTVLAFRFAVPAILSLAFAGNTVSSHAPVPVVSDTIVVRVMSGGMTEVVFSGVVTVDKSEMRIDRMRTPFELRLPAQPIDATFKADDGGVLEGEIFRVAAGKGPLHAWGNQRFGTMRLFFKPDGSLGFDGRWRIGFGRRP